MLLSRLVLLCFWATLSAYVACNPTLDTSTLQLVHAIWRHGDRTPYVTIPSDDVNTESTWNLGLGELTELGAEQEYNLGKIIRQRYGDFLSAKYNPTEIYVRSTDYNRTLASAQSVMAGLFDYSKPPFLPVPIHTTSAADDKILYPHAQCPAADAEENMVYETLPEIKAIEAENREFLTFLAKKGGLLPIPLPLKNIGLLFDPLNSISCHPEEHKPPSWVNETVLKEIRRLYDLRSKFYLHTTLLKRLRGGNLFQDILDRINWKTRNVNNNLKFYAYSAHDTSIFAILSAFGITLETHAKFATAVFIELHKIDGQFFVNLVYKNETDTANIVTMDIPNCPNPCDLDRLNEISTFMISKNWDEECQAAISRSTRVNGWIHHENSNFCEPVLLFLVFLMLVVVLIMAFPPRMNTDSATFEK